MIWFWYFLFYSFCGFLLEIAFAALTRHPKRDRKCFRLLPLCPVYGLGAAAILLLPGWVKGQPALLALFGALAATGVEYLVGAWDQHVLGVRFWDYSGLPGSAGGGKVCLLFTAAWGLLALPLVWVVHPAAARWAAALPAWLFWPVLLLTAGDALGSAARLRAAGTTDCLRWGSQLS